MANWIIQDVGTGQVGFPATLPCCNVDDSVLWHPRWAPELRGPRTYDRGNWRSLWSASTFGGSSTPESILNQNFRCVDPPRGYEPDSVGLAGNQSDSFTTPINVPAQWQIERFDLKPRAEARA